MKRIFLGLLIIAVILKIDAYSQLFSNHYDNLEQHLLELKNNNVLMSIAYEPSQEDALALAYYRYKFGVKTYSLFLTRGEGGENMTGTELYQELGVKRSSEEKNAAKILGTDPYYLNFMDNGQVKDINQLYKIWGGKDSVLSKVVFLIRKLKPDVIIFGSTHKSQLVSRNNLLEEVISESVKMASGTSAFAFQLKSPYFKTWKVKKVFQLENEAGKNDIITINGNENNLILNKTYSDIASSAISRFNSLDMNKHLTLLNDDSYYKLFYSDKKYRFNKNDFFSDIKLKFKESENFDKSILNLIKNINNKDKAVELASIIDRNIDLLKIELSKPGAYDPLADRVLTSLKFKISDLKVFLLGIKIIKNISDSAVAQRQVFEVRFDTIYNLSPGETRIYFLNVDPNWIILRGKDYNNNLLMAYHTPIQLVTPETYPLTQPANIYQYKINFKEPALRYAILHKAKEPAKSFQYFDAFDFESVPKAILNVKPGIVFIKDNRTFEYDLTNYLNDQQTNISVRVSNDDMGSSYSKKFNIPGKYGTSNGTIDFRLADSIQDGSHNLFFTVGKPIFSRVIAKKFDCQIEPDIFIGLVKSNDETFENFLKDLHLKYKSIEEPGFTESALQKFSTIVIDCEAYGQREDLKENFEKINNYIRNGGNVVILSQQKSRFVDKMNLGYLCLPLTISDKSIVDRKSKVSVLDPKHPFFNFPNKINIYDWQNWIQERAMYYPVEYNQYQELIALEEPGEKIIKSGILYAKYGKGSITYTCLTFNRQLFSVVEGAYRLMANIISQQRVK